MRLNLETLKETKGKVKEFAFLTPVASYISENYGELVNELDGNMIREIFIEIAEGSKLSNPIAIYETPTSFSLRGVYSYNISTNSEKEGLDRFTCSRNWSDEISLKEVYYISDLDAYDVYLEKLEEESIAKYIKDQEERIAKRKEEELERQAKVASDKALREEFNLDRGADTSKAAMFKAIFDEKTDKATRYKEFVKLADIEIDESLIREIAYEEARDTVCEHVYDEH